jgi:hypothetical protein
VDLNDNRLANYPVRWRSMTQEIIRQKLAPLIDKRIAAFLQTKDSEMVEFVLETILPPT